MKEKLGYLIQIAPNALINSRNGTYRLDKIPNSTFVQNSNGKKQKIINKVSQQTEKIYELHLRNGHIINLGPETIVETLEGYKKVKELSPEDYLRHKISGVEVVPEKGEKKINWEDELNTSANPIKVPDTMSVEFALWLGIREKYLKPA
jgi:hypothetical protein